MALAAPSLPFVGYTPPQAPGAPFAFHRPDGSPLLIAGPEAQRMAGLIDRQAPQPPPPPMPDQRLAMNDPPPQPEQWTIPGQPASSADIARNVTDAATRFNGPIQTQPAQEQPAPAQEQQGPPPPLPGAAPPRAASGGAPGFLPQAPTGGGGKPHLATTKQEVTTEGGVVDPALRQQYQDAAKAHIESVQANANAQKAAWDEQAATSIATANAAAKQAQDDANALEREQARKRLVQDQFQKRMDIAAAEQERQAKREVDQGRIFKGKPGAQVAAAIFAAMGEFGRAIIGGPNTALDILNRRIDNDVNAQRDEILAGRAKADNDVQRIRNQYGLDLDESARLVQHLYTSQAAAQAKQTAAQLGTSQAKLGAAQVDQWAADKQAGINAGWMDAVNGKIKTVEEQRMQGGGGTMSGWHLNPDGTATFFGAHGKAEQERDAQGNFYNVGEKKTPKGGGKGGVDPVQASISTTASAAERLGLERDKNTNLYKAGEKADEYTGWLGKAHRGAASLTNSEDLANYKEAARSIAEANARTSRGVNMEQADRNYERIMAAPTGKAKAEVINDIHRAYVASQGDQGSGEEPAAATSGEEHAAGED